MSVAEQGASAVVLAAGLGQRMRSSLPKALLAVGGRPMVERVLAAACGAGLGHAVVVTGSGAEQVEAAIRKAAGGLPGLRIDFARQAQQRGTGDATLQALPLVAAGTVVVLPCDAPLLGAGQIRDLLAAHLGAGAGITLLTARMTDPTGYGRVLRLPDGGVAGIVEERDATPQQRALTEVFTLVACFRRDLLASALAECGTDNAQGEMYLPDTVGIARRRGEHVQALVAPVAAEVMGANDRRALAAAEAALRTATLQRLMDAGVSVIDPATTFVDESATIGADSTLLPMTVIEGACSIGPGCEIGPGAHIRESRIDAACRIWHSVIEQSEVGPECRVGPYAHLRPGSRLGRGVEVGNFAEVKNAILGDGTKQHHHSYVGDAELGVAVNVGAGAITVNFDGQRKHRTKVGAGAFIGCNVNLVAPLEVGRGAFLAAGSTVNRPVPDDALAIARARQEVKDGWAARKRRASPEGGA